MPATLLLFLAAALGACVGDSAPLLAVLGASPLLAIIAAALAFARLVPWALALPLAAGASAGAWLARPIPDARLPAAALLGVLAAWIAVKSFRALDDELAAPIRPPIALLALVAGTLVGAAATCLGIGAGALLAPSLILLRWATTRIAIGCAALVALAVGLVQLRAGPLAVPPIGAMGAVALGALAGAHFGAGHMPVGSMRRAIALVLGLAAAATVL